MNHLQRNFHSPTDIRADKLLNSLIFYPLKDWLFFRNFAGIIVLWKQRDDAIIPKRTFLEVVWMEFFQLTPKNTENFLEWLQNIPPQINYLFSSHSLLSITEIIIAIWMPKSQASFENEKFSRIWNKSSWFNCCIIPGKSLLERNLCFVVWLAFLHEKKWNTWKKIKLIQGFTSVAVLFSHDIHLEPKNEIRQHMWTMFALLFCNCFFVAIFLVFGKCSKSWYFNSISSF